MTICLLAEKIRNSSAKPELITENITKRTEDNYHRYATRSITNEQIVAHLLLNDRPKDVTITDVSFKLNILHGYSQPTHSEVTIKLKPADKDCEITICERRNLMPQVLIMNGYEPPNRSIHIKFPNGSEISATAAITRFGHSDLGREMRDGHPVENVRTLVCAARIASTLIPELEQVWKESLRELVEHHNSRKDEIEVKLAMAGVKKTAQMSI